MNHITTGIRNAIIISTILLGLPMKSQTLFQRMYGFSATSYLKEIIPLNNPGSPSPEFLLCGTLVANGIYMMKTDAGGQMLWAKGINNSAENYPLSFQKCDDGGIIMCGYIRDSNFNWDVFLLRTDSLANVLWSAAYGGGSNDVGSFARQTSDGGFIVCGNTLIGSQHVRQFLMKTDSQGLVQWTKTYSDTGSSTIADAKHVIELSDGYVFCGRNQVVNSPGTNFDGTIFKTDLLGNLLWSKSYGFAEWDQFNQLLPTADGGFAVCGWVDTIAGGNVRDMLLAKFDSVGNFQWAKAYGGPGDDLGYTFDLIGDQFIIGGKSTSFTAGQPDFFAVRTYSTGTYRWSWTYGSTNDEELFTCHPVLPDGYVFGGTTLSFGVASHRSYFIKTNGIGYSGCNGTEPATQNYDLTLPLVMDAFIQFNDTLHGYSISSTTSVAGVSTNFLCTNTSVLEDLANYSIEVFPNPFSEQIQIDIYSERFGKLKVRLYDVLGNMIQEFDLTGGRNNLNLDVVRGIYTLTILSESGREVRKIVKQ